MTFLFYFFIFFLGLVVGSFLNCVICRLERGESFLKGRSYCPRCKHQLSWPDLIPVFSFIILRGRCRYCSQKISWQYPLVEIAAGLLFILEFWKFGFVLDFGFWILISCFLVVIFVYDLKHYLIPDKVVFPAIAIALLWALLAPGKQQPGVIYSAAAAAGFFASVVLISRGKWMGVGDIKLAFLMGLIFGFPDIVAALFLAFFFGAIMGMGLIMLGKKKLKSEVPFGPFLVAGTLLSLFWGETALDWYFNLFL